MGLVDRIQAIAQNMSDMAVRVEQILQRSMANSRGTALKHTWVHMQRTRDEYQRQLHPV